MESEVHALLQRLVTAPEDHARHICRFTTGLAILVIYFHRVTSNDDEIVAHGKASMDLLVNEMAPGPPKGIWAVDVFPFLKNIPEWFPFAGFKRKAALWRAHMAEFADRSLREAMQRMIEGSAIPSLCSIIPHDSDVVAEEEYILRWAANSMFGGLPHCVRKDDQYADYFIPNGSIVMANIMAMTRDEKLFPSPEDFIPDRFDVTVDEAVRDATDPRQWIFGFGCRRCPDVHLAEASTWLALVSTVSALDGTHPIDHNGDIILPEIKYDNMVFRTPSAFQCQI
ncbi:hypothetical protein CERSUDRAFT_99122 [Gelatoporia subvermispora B]|uniref:Cytochrome P450 n=1 Tax=Ceriporiopsis subvermispora (strain B) TaxID=914234 RepID=M2R1H4_CERS8|nr:hypothetical protein CERSUDRAFT_99122 [Gelatoporia subvermispora B]